MKVCLGLLELAIFTRCRSGSQVVASANTTPVLARVGAAAALK